MVIATQSRNSAVPMGITQSRNSAVDNIMQQDDLSQIAEQIQMDPLSFIQQIGKGFSPNLVGGGIKFLWDMRSSAMAAMEIKNNFDSFDQMIQEHMTKTGEVFDQITPGTEGLKECMQKSFEEAAKQAHLALAAAGVMNTVVAIHHMQEANTRWEAIENMRHGLGGIDAQLAEAKAIYVRLEADFKSLEPRAQMIVDSYFTPENISRSPTLFLENVNDFLLNCYALNVKLEAILQEIERKRSELKEKKREANMAAAAGAGVGAGIGAGLTLLSLFTPTGAGTQHLLGCVSVGANVVGTVFQCGAAVLEIRNIQLVNRILEELFEKEKAVRELKANVNKLEEVANDWKKKARRLLERDSAGQY